MNLSLLRSSCTIKVLLIALAMSMPDASRAQRKKGGQEPEQTVLQKLHPDFIEMDPPKGISLLSGYRHKGARDFEGNQVGEIWKNDGVKIRYEMGFSEGLAVDPEQKVTYAWYQEQKVNGRVTRYALSKRNVLTISIPLDDAPKTLHVANFYGTIKKPNDVADMVLMILPFAYN